MNKLSLPAWALAIVGAFAVSIESGVTVLIGVVGQWVLNAPKKMNDVVAACGILAAALVAYKGLHWNAPLNQAFFSSAAVWMLAAVGSGSLAGKTGGAPKTNSL